MLTQELEVYKIAHALTLQIYKLTDNFPGAEQYGLVSQMRRAAVSINSNLMEGSARRTHKEKLQFIGISRGSTAELKYQTMVARDLGFMESEDANQIMSQLDLVARMLTGLIKLNQE